MSGRKKLFCAVFLALCLICLICRMPSAVFAEPAGDSSVPTSSASGTETTPPGEDPDAAAKKAAEEAAAKKAAEEAAAKKAAEEAAAKKAAEEAAAKKAAEEAAEREAAREAAVTENSDEPLSSVPASSSFVSSLPAAPPSSGILLPGVDSVSETDPLASAAENRASSSRMNLYGILAWACIGLGIAVVLIVVLSNRRPPRGPGRSRYHRPKRGGKHLLDSKYYRDVNRY